MTSLRGHVPRSTSASTRQMSLHRARGRRAAGRGCPRRRRCSGRRGRARRPGRSRAARGRAATSRSRGADDRRERRGAARDRVVEGGAQRAELLAAPDELRRDRAGERRHIRSQPYEPVGGERQALPLGVNRRCRLGVHDVGHRRVGRGTDQHLAGRRSLLEPSCDVDSVSVASFWSGVPPPRSPRPC